MLGVIYPEVNEELAEDSEPVRNRRFDSRHTASPTDTTSTIVLPPVRGYDPAPEV
jgi:hypothetical protein